MMINKKKAIIIMIVLVVLTNALTFIGSNGISLVLGNKVLISREKYDDLVKYDKLFQVRDIIKRDYVDPIDENKLVEGAVRGLAEGVEDPYTVYWDPKEYESNNIQTEGEYAGVGLVVEPTEDNLVLVVAPIEDTPAEKAGILPGDIIVKVDDKEVSGKNLDYAVSLMRGKAGTEVKVTIARKGEAELKDFVLKRANIVLKSVKGEIINSDIGYIRITAFQSNTAESFKQTLDALKSRGIKGLIIDLRNNGGGLLDQSIEVADALVGQGLIVYTIDNKGNKEVATANPDKLDMPLAILVNGNTASASEIVSGAVKDSKSGVLVGTRTFGKGLVQAIDPVGDGSAVKVTIARYYTPSGICIQGTGIEPNVVIDLPEELKTKRELTRQEDIQLLKAVDVIRQQMK